MINLELPQSALASQRRENTLRAVASPWRRETCYMDLDPADKATLHGCSLASVAVNVRTWCTSVSSNDTAHAVPHGQRVQWRESTADGEGCRGISRCTNILAGVNVRTEVIGCLPQLQALGIDGPAWQVDLPFERSQHASRADRTSKVSGRSLTTSRAAQLKATVRGTSPQPWGYTRHGGGCCG